MLERLQQLEQQAIAAAGEEFNLASPKQLGEVLFDEMSLPGGKKGKTGAYGTGADVRTPRPGGELDLDTAFGGLTLAPLPGEPDASVRGASAWLEAPDGRRLTLWQNADWGFVQVFTTQIFPKAGERVAAVAVEPMTAPPDALNSGQGLIWLEPGERWEGSWGLVYGA